LCRSYPEAIRKAGQFDEPVAEELEVRALPRRREHRQEVVGADVDREPQPAVEGEPLRAYPLVEQTELGPGEKRPPGAARGVEGAVAEELLEAQPVPRPDLIHPSEEAHHLAHRQLLGSAAAPPQLLEELGELHEVVEQPVAPDHRREDAGRGEVERPRGAGELHDLALDLRHGPEAALGDREHAVAQDGDDLEALAALREVGEQAAHVGRQAGCLGVGPDLQEVEDRGREQQPFLGQPGRVRVDRGQHAVEARVEGAQPLDLLGGHLDEPLKAHGIQVEVALEEGVKLLQLGAEADLRERDEIAADEVGQRPRGGAWRLRLAPAQAVDGVRPSAQGDVGDALCDGVADLVHGPRRNLGGVGGERSDDRAQSLGHLAGQDEQEDLRQVLPVVVEVRVLEDLRDPPDQVAALLDERGLVGLLAEREGAAVRGLGFEQVGQLAAERLPRRGDAQREPEHERGLLGFGVQPVRVRHGGRGIAEQGTPSPGLLGRGQESEARHPLAQRLLDRGGTTIRHLCLF
jgi:hypothetical protein